MFVIRPCCCSGRRHRPDPSMDPYSHMAAVLPSSVSHAEGNKFKKKTGTRHQQQPVNVNIIVDPRLFSSHSQPGSEPPSSASHPLGAVRPSPFIIIALETEWLRARKALKVKLAVDILICLLWLVTFVLAILNERCPPGKFQGWCVSQSFIIILRLVQHITGLPDDDRNALQVQWIQHSSSLCLPLIPRLVLKRCIRHSGSLDQPSISSGGRFSFPPVPEMSLCLIPMHIIIRLSLYLVVRFTYF
jgi:hypothetical protein